MQLVDLLHAWSGDSPGTGSPGTGSDRYCYQDASRSSGFAVPRSAQCLAFRDNFKQCGGVVDQDYIGEIKVLLTNLGDKPFPVRREIAWQMVFLPVLQARLNLVDGGIHRRGSGGFGSTGR